MNDDIEATVEAHSKILQAFAEQVDELDEAMVEPLREDHIIDVVEVGDVVQYDLFGEKREGEVTSVYDHGVIIEDSKEYAKGFNDIVALKNHLIEIVEKDDEQESTDDVGSLETNVELSDEMLKALEKFSEMVKECSTETPEPEFPFDIPLVEYEWDGYLKQWRVTSGDIVFDEYGTDMDVVGPHINCVQKEGDEVVVYLNHPEDDEEKSTDGDSISVELPEEEWHLIADELQIRHNQYHEDSFSGGLKRNMIGTVLGDIQDELPDGVAPKDRWL